MRHAARGGRRCAVFRRRIGELLDELERYTNKLNDWDLQWWPFLFLRPARDQRLGTGRVVLLALLYGLFGGLLANVVFALAGQPHEPWAYPLLFTACLFLAYRGIYAFCWNRRAERLQRTARCRERLGGR